MTPFVMLSETKHILVAFNSSLAFARDDTPCHADPAVAGEASLLVMLSAAKHLLFAFNSSLALLGMTKPFISKKE